MNKEETLYLPIKQVYFDEIIAGTKKAEYREIKEGITAKRYLLKDASGKYMLNPEVTNRVKNISLMITTTATFRSCRRNISTWHWQSVTQKNVILR